MNDTLFSNIFEHVSIFVSGATFVGIVAHAVNTFPVPVNRYGRWALGTVQYIVGQRKDAMLTRNGNGNGATGQFQVPDTPKP